LDSDYLASYIPEMHNGRTSGEATHLHRINEYEDTLKQFEQIRPTLTGQHQGFDHNFKKPQNKELFVKMAREYIKTWYQMIEEFPDILEDIMEKKLKRDEKKYINTASDCIRSLPSNFYSGTVFINTDPQPWGYGIKPTNWREGDPEVTKEEHDIKELSQVNLTRFKECHCQNPVPGKL